LTDLAWWQVTVSGHTQKFMLYRAPCSRYRSVNSLGLNIRPRNGIVAALGSSFNRVELDEGSFSTKILSVVVDTQFSPFVSISNNVQYDTVSRILGWQFRFRQIVGPGNDIYLVWVNNWLDTGEAFTTAARSAAAKLVYTHRF
jgi:hypothetical protein